MEVAQYPAGTVVVREGDRARAAFLLLEGAAAVERGDEALGVLEPGALFGELALVAYTRRTATVTTTAPSLVAVIPEQMFRQLLESDRSFSRRVFAVAASRA